MNQLVKLSPNQIKEQIAAKEEDYASMLGEAIDVSRFRMVAANAILQDTNIYMAYCRDPRAILAEVALAAQDGLLIDKRQAALVPFKGAYKYMPMMAGLKIKASKSPDVAKINDAQLVYENDEFSYEAGDNEEIIHKPDPFASKKDRGALKGAYAVAHLKNGQIKRSVMSLEELKKRRAISKAKNGPWAGWEEEMYKKTVMKALCNSLPIGNDIFLGLNENVLDGDIPEEINEQTGEDKPEIEDFKGSVDAEFEEVEPDVPEGTIETSEFE